MHEFLSETETFLARKFKLNKSEETKLYLKKRKTNA